MILSQDEIERILKDLGVLKKGHYLLASGRHSSFYFEKFRILEEPEYASLLLSHLLSVLFEQVDCQFDKVCGPATGGMFLAFEIGRKLGLPAIYLEKKNGGFSLLRGMKVNPGEKILIVDDVLTTGKSIFNSVDLIEKLKGNVQALAVMIDRRKKMDEERKIVSVFRSEGEDYARENCPLCLKNIPLVDPKTGKEI